MELKISSKPGGLLPPGCASDPEEKEVSDEDDDDRNHKHRRRETLSQSLERDSLEPVFTNSYKKRKKPFENGHSFKENESQGSETWKNYNIAPLDKDFTPKFDKRRPGIASISRVNMDLNQRMKSNQSFGEPGHGRGRGRDLGSWSQCDRFSSVDIASQMVRHGSITPSLFPGRGLPNPQNESWNAFGLIPAIPNGGLDALHPIGLQGTLRPAVNNLLNMGFPRQRCRDFEERGFCLRGDMCPMEHGVNRIVVEDVQSLSQFNLPVSLPSAPLVGPVGPGDLPSVGASSTTFMNSKSHSSSKAGAVVDDGLFNGAFSGSAAAGGADLYDPDQPLWNHNGTENSNSLLALHPSKDDETESVMSADTSEHHNSRLHDGTENESALNSSGIPATSQTANSSVWGRVGMKNKLEKIDLAVGNSDYLNNKNREDQDALVHIQGSSRQGTRFISEDTTPSIMDSSAKSKSDTSRFMRKPSQKAQRTLFVCGIPQKSNIRDALLLHFQKFGEVVDIYIPVNNERAFVQFSKREEAEAALRAPDAVMGNRFIKLWWANRDTIPCDGINYSSNVSSTPCGVPAASVQPRLFTVNKGKDNLPAAVSEGTIAPPEASLSSNDHPKQSITNGPKAPPPLQKKLELEQLKEELRKKQELLAQKRNDFWRQLHKLEKHATFVKGEVLSEPAAKRPGVNIASVAAKVTAPRPSNPAANMQFQHSETIADKNKSTENVILSRSKTKTLAVQQEPTGLKQPIHPLAAAGTPFLMNRYKLDNRPTAFRIIPPLPLGLANDDALKEHFSSHGDLSSVELEEIEATDDSDGREVPKTCSALVTFTTRHSAERAFSNGKSWQGNKLQFVWATCSTSGTENIPPASKGLLDNDSQPAEKLLQTDSHEACVSGNEEPETPDRNGDAVHDEVHEVSEPFPTSVPDDFKSPKFKGSAAPLFRKEEAPETEPGPTAVSEEKESSADNAC